MTRLIRTVLSACFAATSALALAACSQTTGGTPAPASGTASSSPPPVNVEPYRTKPCDLLAPSAVNSFGYTEPGSPTTDGSATLQINGQSCAWHSVVNGKSRSLQIGIALTNTNPRHPGLSDIYDNAKTGLVAYAVPTDVSGYPAVFADLRDDRPKGICTVTFAVSDTQLLTAGTTGYTGAQDSCDTAKQAAEDMIKTLKGA